MSRIFATSLTLSFLSSLAAAQLPSAGEPLSPSKGLPEHLPILVLPEPDLASYRAEDAAQEGIGPYRYGAVIPTTLDIEQHGRWDQVEETGEYVWRAEIASPGAYSLGVLFGEYDLPDGARLFLYSPDRTVMLGAFTNEIEQANGMLAIQPLAGDRVVLEYVQPEYVTGAPRLSVESVVHDYRDVLGQTGGGVMERVSCMIDVNCPQGASYQDVKQAVVALFRGGFTCTGTMLNNTAEDAAPYMYTAVHCGSFTNGTFVFNYERSGCGTGSSNQNDSLSGATLVASNNYIDSQLYLLNQAPPQSFNPFYAGWGRSSTPPKPVLCISHPAGLPRKISIDNDKPLDGIKNWIVQWDAGEIKGGSSGSALLNAAGRAIGSLTGGSGACAGQIMSYGKFSKFFANSNLAPVLDPLGTGAVYIDGFDPFKASATTYNGGGTNADLYSSLTLPALGTTWVAEVDVSAHAGATTTIIDGYANSAAGQVFAFGELLVDLGSSRYFRSTAGVSGGLSTHSNPIPNDPSFQGAVAFSQAFIFGGALEATNGVRLRVY